jgi:hypothetical protein
MATLEADQLPEVPDDGLLVKTLYVGICHVETDETTGEPTLIEG